MTEFNIGIMPSNKENTGRSGKRKASPVSSTTADNDEDYRTRRNKNNEAVKKSRDKSKKKAAETQQRVDHLKRENLLLEAKISYHKDRLKELKEIFLTHAKSSSMNLNINFDELLKDDSDNEDTKKSKPSTSTS